MLGFGSKLSIIIPPEADFKIKDSIWIWV